MRSPDAVAADHYAERQRLVSAAAQVAAALWARLDPARVADSWRALLPELTVVVTGAQRAAAAPADGYLDDIMAAQDIPPEAGSIEPRAFAGVASDGRDLPSLLYQPAFTTLIALGSGAPTSLALAAGLATLDMITRTQVADAGRVADGVALTGRRAVEGYVRMVVGKTCSRCIILAGRWYRWNAGFKRHPRCDCVHIPSRESIAGSLKTNPKALFADMSRAEQDRTFGKAGATAIREGASISQVVNARRGMYDAAGKNLTRESTGRHGLLPGRVRLMPEQIYREAGDDRDLAIRLLRSNGYLH